MLRDVIPGRLGTHVTSDTPISQCYVNPQVCKHCPTYMPTVYGVGFGPNDLATKYACLNPTSFQCGGITGRARIPFYLAYDTYQTHIREHIQWVPLSARGENIK